jgi:hypothetical protein
VGGAYAQALGAGGPSLLVLKRDGSSTTLGGRFLVQAGGRCLLPSCAERADGTWTASREFGITTISLQATLDGADPWQRALIAFDAPDGVHVVDPLDGATDLVAQSPCQQTGCYGQVCADSRVITSCIYRPEDACYRKDGFCARDSSGTCGWVATPDLQQCVADPPCQAMPIGSTCRTPQGTCEELRCTHGQWACPPDDVRVGLTPENCVPGNGS